MPLDKKYAQDMLELLRGCGQVTGRAMFGGFGIWERGVMFALLDSESVLYFKTNSNTESMYQAEGASQFAPTITGKDPLGMPYWSVPAAVLDDQEELEKWAKQAISVAHTSASIKNIPKPSTKKASTRKATSKPAKKTTKKATKKAAAKKSPAKKASAKKTTTKKATKKPTPKRKK